jgi:hypothetical protein
MLARMGSNATTVWAFFNAAESMLRVAGRNKMPVSTLSIDIDDFMRIAFAPTHNYPIGNGEVGGDPFTRSWREHSPAFQQNIGRNIASSRG